MMKNLIYKVSPIPLEENKIKLNEALFHNANGYIGVRYDFEEGYPEGSDFLPSQYINSFYDIFDTHQAENLFGLIRKREIILNIANTQGITLILDDEIFSMFEGEVLESSLELDMQKGITTRKVKWRSPKGKAIELKITRMASFFQLPLFTIEYEINCLNFSGKLDIISTHDGDVFNYHDPHDPRNASEKMKLLIPVLCEVMEGFTFITSKTTASDLTVCSCVGHHLSQDCEHEHMIKDHKAKFLLETEAVQGKPFKLIKYAVFCDSLRHENCRKQAFLEMEKARSHSLDYLYQQQVKYLSAFWDHSWVEIEGDDQADLALKYNVYQLIQSVGKDRFSNISPKGLSGDGYEGHYFWDTEMYIQPFFTITQPEISKSLISYRYNSLPKARENAQIMGHSKGVLYPWRTITGKECSGYFPAGSAQYHINGAIAHSIISYYFAVKDQSWLINEGLEVIFETARLWLETGNFHQGRFLINTVTGPDEYTCIVNNNFYTNAIAQYHLQWAAKWYRLFQDNGDFQKLIRKIKLTEEEIDAFEQAAEKMYLPYDETLDINPQDDSFLQKKRWEIDSIPPEKFPLLLNYHPLFIYRHQICKQVDTILAHYILEDLCSTTTIRNSYAYYEKISTHDSSLSKSIFCIMAARLSMVSKAWKYFMDVVHLDLKNLCKNTKDGIHTANMAGSYLALVYGFAGFRMKEEGLFFEPCVPEQWKGYQFCIAYRDSRIHVEVNHTECVFKLKQGSKKELTIYGKTYTLEDMLKVELQEIKETVLEDCESLR